MNGVSTWPIRTWIAVLGIIGSAFLFSAGWLTKAALIEYRVADLEKSREKIEFAISEQSKAVNLDHQALLDMSVDVGEMRKDIHELALRRAWHP